MDRFSEIMQTVLKWEGGYVNNPHDRGGPTNYGITHKVLAEWRGVASVTPNQVKNMTKEEAVDIFRHRYWGKIDGDRLPPPIDLIVMDGAVNHGAPNMLRLLQEAVGVAATGQMNRETRNAVTARASSQDSLLDLAVKLAEARKARYVNHPDARHFIAGWRNRLNDVVAVALKPYPVTWSFKDGTTAVAGAGATEPAPVSSIPQAAIDDEDLQAALTQWGLYTGDIDGLFGPKSAAALDALLTRQSPIVASGWQGWPLVRRKIALGQFICRDLDIEVGSIDGLFGPQTQSAFESFQRKKHGLPEDAWRDEIDQLPPPQPGPAAITTWPRQADVAGFFGQLNGPPGNECKFIPLKRLALPYTMKIAWDLGKEVTGFMIHEKVHDSAARVFDKIYAHYSDDGVEEIGANLFGGCFNCRKVRGGSAWSMHSWVDRDRLRPRPQSVEVEPSPGAPGERGR